MLGRLDFNYFICVYLPGLPLCLAVLLPFIGAADVTPTDKFFDSDFKWVIAGYFLVVPIIFGIYIDGIREYCSGQGQDGDKWLFNFGKRINADDFKQSCSKLKYPDPVLIRALERYTLFDYVCQFFANMFFSLSLASIILIIYMMHFYNNLKDTIYLKELCLLLIVFFLLILLSLSLFYVYKGTKDIYIRRWFNVKN